MPSRIERLPLDHPDAKKAQATIGLGQLLDLPQVPLGDGGWCYWNVEKQVAKAGGDLVLGWKIQHWPGRFVVAVYHAVWRNSKGSMVDITAKVPSDGIQGTTFAVDHSHTIDLTKPQHIADMHHVLDGCLEVRELISAQTSQLNLLRSTAPRLLAAGAVWRPFEIWDTARGNPAVIRPILACRE